MHRENSVTSSVSLNPLIGLQWPEFLGTLSDMARMLTCSPGVASDRLGAYLCDLAEILAGVSSIDPAAGDQRFSDPEWRANPRFRVAMQTYLAAVSHWREWVEQAPVDERRRQQLRYVVDCANAACSPSNAWFANPVALRRARETGGMSLVAGWRNMVTDLARGSGFPAQVDGSKFRVGENLACTPGSVVYRCEMFELLQYRPVTAEVFARPQLLVPPLVNKYYLVDLAPGRSLVEAMLARAGQVFVLSWRNPRPEHCHWGLDRYAEAIVEAIDTVRAVTGMPDVNLHGICGGARVMVMALAALAAKRALRQRVHAISLVVANLITDEVSPGLFATPRAMAAVKQRSAERGVLGGKEMARTFTLARPEDLVWHFWVNNYLLGKQPAAFDLLYWNGDNVNLAAKVHHQLLDVYAGNLLAKPDALTVLGEAVDLRRIDCEAFVAGGSTDHISPWERVYQSAQLLGGPFEYCLNLSGHVQTVVSPPGNPKARYLINRGAAADGAEWRAAAEVASGSWWQHWFDWVAARSGELMAAPAQAGSGACPPLGPAPGTYVLES